MEVCILKILKKAFTLAEVLTGRGALPPVAAKTGFTLAEILITLGIIGIVAAMTIPTLIEKNREKQTVALVKEAYSIFSQAYKLVIAEHEGLGLLVDTNLTDKENATKMFQEVSKHLKKAKSCDVNTDCLGSNYVNLQGSNVGIWDDYANIQTGVLLNGIGFWILSFINEDGSYNGQIGIDINGSAKPNKLGVDFFHFRVNENGEIFPTGSVGACKVAISCPDEKPYYLCDLNSTGKYNGYGCTNWLIQHGNMKYLKQNIVNEK